MPHVCCRHYHYGQVRSDGRCTVDWCDVQPMPQIEQNGPDFKYVVTFERLDQENAQELRYTVQDPEAWHYVVRDRNLGIYKPYRITVKANNERGDSTADLNSVIGYSGENGETYHCCFHARLYHMLSMFCSDSFKDDAKQLPEL